MEDLDTAMFDRFLECRDGDDRRRAKESAVLAAYSHAVANAPGYRTFLASRGFQPDGTIDIERFMQLPVLKKSGMPMLQQEHPPFGGFLAVPPSELRRIYISPGPLYDPEGRTDDYWRLRQAVYTAGFRRGDVVMNTFSYHLTPAGSFLDEAAGAVGCVTVPTGVGNTDIQIRTMADLKITGYIGVASFLLTLLKKAEESGYAIGKDIVIGRALVAGELLTQQIRSALNAYGVTVRQLYATAEVGTIGYECPRQEGFHVAEDIHVDICDPDTGAVLPDGEAGEVVVTTFANRIYPLVRYGTGDLSLFLAGPCGCGRTSRRLKGILGRTDQVTKIKGMFVYPHHVDAVTAAFPDAIAGARLVVEQRGHADSMSFQVLLKQGAPTVQPGMIEEKVREITKLRADICFVDELPQDGKKIDDRRNWGREER